MRLELINVPQFSIEFCDSIITELDAIEDKRFTDRSRGMTLYRTVDRSAASYRSMINLDIPKSIREKLIAKAPPVGNFLEEVIINRYHPGDFIPKHLDTHPYPKFCVVPLVESGDGFSAYFDGANGEETFYEDIIGTGLLVSGTKLVHEVKPVKHKRYVVLYLYL
jgi:hypothetical protein